MNKDELVSYIVTRYETLYTEQANFRELWQDEADYINPRKSPGITATVSPGSKQTTKLFDSTAQESNELLAASMNGALTSSSIKWFSLKIRGLDTQDKNVSDWLDACSEKMNRAIQQSNFNAEVQECYLDLGAFGTAAIDIKEKEIQVPGFNGLRFKAYSIGEYVIDEDADGWVNVVIRKFSLGARAVFDKWGKDAGEKIADLAKSKPTQRIEILHAVLPLGEIGRSNAIHKYASIYIDLGNKTVMEIGGYREFPVCVPRWAKSSGEIYGRGPGFTAMPDIHTLNKAIELGLSAWAKSIDPPLQVLDGSVIGSIRLQPAALNYVTTKDALQPIESKARFDVSQIKEGDLKTSIRRIFFSDQLQFQDTPQMTATEVYVRYELMQRLLGPTLGRLESELLNPLIKRIFALMFRAGAFDPVPPALLKYRELDVEYEGPMARAQRASEVVAVQRTLQIIAPFATAAPEILDWYDTDKIAKFAPTVTGMPSVLLRSDKQVREIRDKRAKIQAIQQMKETALEAAKGVGDITPLLQNMMGPQNKSKEGVAA